MTNNFRKIEGCKLVEQAKEFRSKYDCKDGVEHRGLQKSLIDEEWSEFHEAFHFKKSSEQLKELADLVYVCYQYAVSQGWDLATAMERVHQSNLSKLGNDGKPVFRADGKLMKGPNYRPPDLEDLIPEEDDFIPSELESHDLYNDFDR